MKLCFLVAPMLVVTAGAFATTNTSELPKMSHSLAGVVDDDRSLSFACSFGTFEVQNAKNTARGIEATLKGAGILVNSGYLHYPVEKNPLIVYRFANHGRIKNGAKLSVVCLDGLSDEKEAAVRYYVPHQEP